ncbi:MAG: DUF1700 domain-containing protein [Eubacteriales bacterium]|nr:DUF1700 domain-containing protein [Eubacteriales bacterium]
MNRAEFMGRLRILLAGIPESEREAALQYYNDYLDDAGTENEEEVLASLGSPEKVAASIREGLQEEGQMQGSLPVQSGRYRSGRREEGGRSALWLILAVPAALVIIPTGFALVVTAGVLALVFLFLLAVFFLVGVTCIVGGIAALLELLAFSASPAEAMLRAGSGLLSIGLGILLALFMGWVMASVCPKAFRGIKGFLGRKLRSRSGRKEDQHEKRG